jgi:hypothetical protein
VSGSHLLSHLGVNSPNANSVFPMHSLAHVTRNPFSDSQTLKSVCRQRMQPLYSNGSSTGLIGDSLTHFPLAFCKMISLHAGIPGFRRGGCAHLDRWHVINIGRLMRGV